MSALWQNPWFVACVALACVLVLSIMSRIANGVRNPVAKETIAQTDTLLKAANKWAVAAQQDANIVMQLMHICYAKAYVTSLRRILSDEQIQKAHRVDMVNLEQSMEALQQKTLSALAEKAPNIMPEGEFAVRTGWLG